MAEIFHPPRQSPSYAQMTVQFSLPSPLPHWTWQETEMDQAWDPRMPTLCALAFHLLGGPLLLLVLYSNPVNACDVPHNASPLCQAVKPTLLLPPLPQLKAVWSWVSCGEVEREKVSISAEWLLCCVESPQCITRSSDFIHGYIGEAECQSIYPGWSLSRGRAFKRVLLRQHKFCLTQTTWPRKKPLIILSTLVLQDGDILQLRMSTWIKILTPSRFDQDRILRSSYWHEQSESRIR